MLASFAKALALFLLLTISTRESTSNLQKDKKIKKFRRLPTEAIKIEQEIKINSAFFYHNFLPISSTLTIKISSYRENHHECFENKSNVEFCVLFDSQEKQKCIFHLFSFKSTHFDHK